MDNIQLTKSEQEFRQWGAERIKLITRTKNEIKKQQLSIRHAEATLERLTRQLGALEKQ